MIYSYISHSQIDQATLLTGGGRQAGVTPGGGGDVHATKPHIVTEAIKQEMAHPFLAPLHLEPA